MEKIVFWGGRPPWASLDPLGLLSKFEENAMDDEVFGGLGPLGSPGLPQVSLTFLQTSRNDCEKEDLFGGQGPPGFPWMP